MENLIQFIKRDINIQLALICITACCIIFFPFIGIALCLLGAWQLFSAIFIWNKIRDSKRRNYLLYCMCHLSLMVGYAVSDYTIQRKLEEVFGGMFLASLFLIIPPILAFWYLSHSYKTLKTLNGDKHEFFTEKEMDEVLDSEEVLK